MNHLLYVYGIVEIGFDVSDFFDDISLFSLRLRSVSGVPIWRMRVSRVVTWRDAG